MTYNPKKKRKTNKDIDYNNSSQLWDPGSKLVPRAFPLKTIHFLKGKALGTRLGTPPPRIPAPPIF